MPLALRFMPLHKLTGISKSFAAIYILINISQVTATYGVTHIFNGVTLLFGMKAG
jgi:hypothetical protein